MGRGGVGDFYFGIRGITVLKSARYCKKKHSAIRCEIGKVEVQWNSTTMCYILQVIWLGKSTVKQESHGLHRK